MTQPVMSNLIPCCQWLVWEWAPVPTKRVYGDDHWEGGSMLNRCFPEGNDTLSRKRAFRLSFLPSLEFTYMVWLPSCNCEMTSVRTSEPARSWGFDSVVDLLHQLCNHPTHEFCYRQTLILHVLFFFFWPDGLWWTV